MIFLLTCFLFSFAWAEIRPVLVDVPSGLNPKLSIPAGGRALPPRLKPLFEIKRLWLEKNHLACVKLARTQRRTLSEVRAWIISAELDCARGVRRDLRRNLELMRIFREISGEPRLLSEAPWGGQILPQFVDAGLDLLTGLQAARKKEGLFILEKLQDLRTALARDQALRLDREGARAALTLGEWRLAEEWAQRAWQESPRYDFAQQMKKIFEKYGRPAPSFAGGDIPPKEVVPELSPEYKESLSRFWAALEKKDFLQAARDGVKILVEFPGSRESKKVSSEFLKTYLAVLEDQRPEYEMIREQIMSEVKALGPDRIGQWAAVLDGQGFYSEAVDLVNSQIGRVSTVSDGLQLLRQGGRSSLNMGEYDKAMEFYSRIEREFNGTVSSDEALFRMGLLHLRMGRWSEAVGVLEKHSATYKSSPFELSVKYWLWRAVQKMGADTEKEMARSLIARFPMTYYGLRAQLEGASGLPDWWKSEKKPIKVELWLSETQRQSWERARILSQATWWREAKSELELLPPAVGAEEELAHASLRAMAADYHSSVALAQAAFEKKPQIMMLPFLRLVFPVEYSSLIEEWSPKNNLDPDLVRGLIKQETSFDPSAVSVAGARGLMQIMPSTGREIARYLKLKKPLGHKELEEPEINIRMGTNYFRRMLRAFSNNLALALAAYNVGIGNMRKWLGGRDLESALGSASLGDPFAELWFDELPWSETSFYVKAVLRNFIMYKLIAARGLVESRRQLGWAPAPTDSEQ